MDLDALLHHYFGTEREPGRRFALWTLMEVFGIAPTPAEAFSKDPALRRAAEDYLTAARKAERDAED